VESSRAPPRLTSARFANERAGGDDSILIWVRLSCAKDSRDLQAVPPASFAGSLFQYSRRHDITAAATPTSNSAQCICPVRQGTLTTTRAGRDLDRGQLRKWSPADNPRPHQHTNAAYALGTPGVAALALFPIWGRAGDSVALPKQPGKLWRHAGGPMAQPRAAAVAPGLDTAPAPRPLRSANQANKHFVDRRLAVNATLAQREAPSTGALSSRRA